MTDENLLVRVEELDEGDSERVLGSVVDALSDQLTASGVNDLDSARRVIAAALSEQSDATVSPDGIVPDHEDPASYVPGTLALLAGDPATAGLVEDAIASLDNDNGQLFADPLTAAVILSAVVIVLQTKFDISFDRKNGKTNLSINVAKGATNNATLGEIIAAVRKTMGV